MRKIQLSEMTPHVHSFAPRENKAEKLSKWIISWIVLSLKNKKIKPGDLLPPKAEFACHIGVSLGTMQNVFRLIEDAGYIESKQKLGSFVKDRTGKPIEKLISKKDLTADFIKKYLKDNKFQPGDILTSTRELAVIAGVSSSTVRSAVMNLVVQGVLEKRKNLFVLTGRSFRTNNITAKTLVDKVALSIKEYIIKNLNPGDRLPTNKDLSAMFGVSLKTVHDSVKQLSKEGVVYTRRGQYGTLVLSITDRNAVEQYNYEKIEKTIKKLIISDYNVGDKLPAIKELAKQFSTSEKTVKKALDNLFDDGYVTFMRGRYGGTFVTEVPVEEKDSYRWLALNSKYSENVDN